MTWRCLRQRLNDDIAKKEKSERRGRRLANGNAKKRGSFAQRMVDAKSDEDELARQGRMRAHLTPLEGIAFLLSSAVGCG